MHRNKSVEICALPPHMLLTTNIKTTYALFDTETFIMDRLHEMAILNTQWKKNKTIITIKKYFNKIKV